MTCYECLRARQLVVHREYAKDCPACSIRALAYMKAQDRERYYDKVCHLSGPAARDELKRNVELERARIAALSAAMPKKETT